MSDVPPSREEIEAHIGRSQAETETKIARIEGKLDLVVAKLDTVLSDNLESRNSSRDEQRATRANIWVVGVALAAIIIAMAVAFPTFFGMGAQVRDIAAQAAREAVTQSQSSPAKPH